MLEAKLLVRGSAAWGQGTLALSACAYDVRCVCDDDDCFGISAFVAIFGCVIPEHNYKLISTYLLQYGITLSFQTRIRVIVLSTVYCFQQYAGTLPFQTRLRVILFVGMISFEGR